MNAASSHGENAEISIRLTHEVADDDCFTKVNVDILLATPCGGSRKKIGHIRAHLVHRRFIAETRFHEAFDSHSEDLEWVGCACMENRFGRTKLQSLVDYDTPESDFLYIQDFHIDDEYKQNGSSEIGAKALRLFLHHSFIKGNNNNGSPCWKVSSAAYILDPTEAMTPAQRAQFKEEREARLRMSNPPPKTAEERIARARYLAQLARVDANPFLRNGFFQDPALLAHDSDGSKARILVVSSHHMQQPLKSHQQVQSIEFCPLPPQVMGHDAKILEAVLKCCGWVRGASPEDDINTTRFHELLSEINSHVSLGGSILVSNALHCAVANNSLKVVTWLLQVEPNAINSMDMTQSTPLMIAAERAHGRSTIHGRIAEVRVMDKLVACGADKSAQDASGMTAYGRFRLCVAEDDEMMPVMRGQDEPWVNHVGVPTPNLYIEDVEIKLYPPNGPSEADLSGGTGANTGLVDYSDEVDDEDSFFDDDEEDDPAWTMSQ